MRSRKRKQIALGLGLLGAIGLASVLAIDLAELEGWWLAGGAPSFEPIFLLRTLLIAASCLLFVRAIAMCRPSAPGSSGQWDGWGSVALIPDDPTDAPALEVDAKRLMLWTVMGLALGSVTVLAIHPRLFSLACWERGPVEILSFLFWLGACWLLGGVVVELRRSGAGPWPQVAAVGLLAFCFLVAMEEVSWGQRVFGFGTPEIFADNLQDEMNLHNFATNFVESAYYFCSFLALVLLPFVADTAIAGRRRGQLDVFIPTRMVLFGAAVAFAFNYDLWNTLPAQIAFFTTLAILGAYAWWWRGRRSELTIVAALFLTCLLTQSILLAFGERLVRRWEATEYQELFIPLAFVIYALEVRRLTRRTAAERTAE